MPLLNVKSKSSTEKDKKIISKTKKSESSYTAVKGIRGGKSLLQRITAVVSALNVYTAKIKDKYEILTDLESIEEYFKDMVKNGEAALDTETSSLDPISCDIAGICLYTPGRKAAYIPLGHISYITLQSVPNQPSKDAVADLFGKYKDNIKWIFHNAKFDIRVMKHKLGVDLNIYWDTQVAAVMLNENEVSKKLKFLYKKYCDPESEESEQYEKLFDGLPFTLIPYSAGYVYAAGDSYKTFALYEFQKQYLNEENLPGPYDVYRNIEIPCIPVTAWMEDNGISFDMDKNEELHNRYHVIRDEREKAVNDIISEYEDDIIKYIRANAKAKLKYPVNINSPLQLSELIYDVIKLTWKGRKNDERGTGEEILQKLDHPLCKAILEYREVDKLISTYIDKLPTMLNPVTGKIHCSFHQNGTVTGRFSSSDPNAQNIPSKNKEIRQMFCASLGHVMVGADYS